MAELPEPLRTRIRLHGWITIEFIGAGGGGKVYLCARLEDLTAVQTLTGNRGAVFSPEDRLHEAGQLLKCLSNGLVRKGNALAALKVPHTDIPNASKRLKREIEAMRSTQHPSLIRLFDADEQVAPEWFVMEWHPNGNLSQFKDQYKGRVAKSLRAMLPVVEAVAELHEKGFIHRDIKPGNIFTADQGHLVLGDLGIAFPTEEGERLTEPSTTLVSRDWIPDWARFTESSPQPKIDVFMLAKVIYFMVTGGQKVLATQLDEEPFDLRHLLYGLEGAAELQEVLLDCITSKEQQCKFTNAKELLIRLQDVLSQLTGISQASHLFSYLSTHSSTHVVVRQSYEQVPRYPSLRRLKIFLPNQCKRLRAQIRLEGLPTPTTFFLFLLIDNCHITPIGSHPFKMQAQQSQAVWSSEILISLASPLGRGWHDLDITITSEQDGCYVTGFVLCGE